MKYLKTKIQIVLTISIIIVLQLFQPAYSFNLHYPAWLPDEHFTDYGEVDPVKDIETTPTYFIIGGYFNHIYPGYNFSTLHRLNDDYPSNSIINYYAQINTALPDGYDGWFIDNLITPNGDYFELAHVLSDGTLDEVFNKRFKDISAYYLGLSSDKQDLYFAIRDNYTEILSIKSFAKYNIDTGQINPLDFNTQLIDDSAFAAWNLIEISPNKVIFLTYESSTEETYIVYIDFTKGDSSYRKFLVSPDTKIKNYFYMPNTFRWDNKYSLVYDDLANTINLSYIDTDNSKLLRHYSLDLNSFAINEATTSNEDEVKSLTLLNKDGTNFLLQFTTGENSKFKITDIHSRSTTTWEFESDLKNISAITTSKDYSYLYLVGEKKDFIDFTCDSEKICRNSYDYKPAFYKVNIESGDLKDSFISLRKWRIGSYSPKSILLNDSESELLFTGYAPQFAAKTIDYIYALDSKTLKLIDWFPELPGPVVEINYLKNEKLVTVKGLDYTAKVALDNEATILCLNDCDSIVDTKHPFPNTLPYQDVIDHSVRYEYISEVYSKIIATGDNKLSIIDTTSGYELTREIEFEGYPLLNSHFSQDEKIFHFAFYENFLDKSEILSFIDYDLENDMVVSEIFKIPGKSNSRTEYSTSADSNYRLLTSKGLAGQGNNNLQFLPYQFPQSEASMENPDIVFNRSFYQLRNEWTLYIRDSGYFNISCSPNSFLDCKNIYYKQTFLGSKTSGKTQEYNKPLYIEKNQEIVYWGENEEHSEPKKTVNIKIDKNPPISHLSKNGGDYEKDEIKVYFHCRDDYESGCEHIYFTLDGSLPQIEDVDYRLWELSDAKSGTNKYLYEEWRSERPPEEFLTIMEDTTINFFAVDKAGRQENVKTVTFKLSEPPWWKASGNQYFFLVLGLFIFTFRFTLTFKLNYRKLRKIMSAKPLFLFYLYTAKR